MTHGSTSVLRAGLIVILAAGALGACTSADKPHAPMAQQAFGGAIGVQGTNGSATDATSATMDAGQDAAVFICTPGAQSTPGASTDPCNQITSSCTLQGTATIAMCQDSHTWGACYCQPMIGAAGMSGTFGTSGTGF